MVKSNFSFIGNIAIDQHVIARTRHFDMFDILKNLPEKNKLFYFLREGDNHDISKKKLMNNNISFRQLYCFDIRICISAIAE
jgi:hypothetical protein